MKSTQHIIGFFLLLIPGYLLAQTPEIDSLNRVLETDISELQRADVHRNLARNLVHFDPVKAIENSTKALEISRKYSDKESLARSMQVHGSMMAITGQFNQALDSLLMPALHIARQLKLKKLEAETLNASAGVYMYQGKSAEALTLFGQAIALFDSLGLHAQKAKTLLNTGSIYSNMGEYEKAITVSFESLRYFESQKDTTLFGHIYNNIAVHYDNWGNYDDALKYYREALRYMHNMGNSYQKSATLNNIGEIYRTRQQYDSALVYYQEAIDIANGIGDPQLIAVPTLSSGELYANSGNYPKALEYTEKALQLFTEIGFAEGMARAFGNLGVSYSALGQNAKALDYYAKSNQKAMETDISDLLLSNYKGLANLWEKSGNTAQALRYYKMYSELKDSLFTSEKSAQIQKLHTLYETEKKEQQIKIQEVEIEKNQAEIARNNTRQRMLIALLAAIAIVVIVVTVGYIEKRKANIQIRRQRDEIQMQNSILGQQKEEIRTQAEYLTDANKQIMKQNQELEASHKQIIDSINYASRIQRAIFGNPLDIEQRFNEAFLFFSPHSVVSGDFFWYSENINTKTLVVADCTGHGVPGAFMTMLGNGLLDQIVNMEREKNPAEILTKLDQKVSENLRKETNLTGKVNDGMDLCVLSFDKQSDKISFAGAKNPLLHISGGEINIIKGSKFAIGGAEPRKGMKKMFELHEIIPKKGDKFYIYSDGFQDQFGGQNNRKYLSSRFKELLLNISEKSAQEQKQILKNELDTWKGDHPQTDDILIAGIMY